MISEQKKDGYDDYLKTNQRSDIFVTVGLTDPGPLGLVLNIEKINEFSIVRTLKLGS